MESAKSHKNCGLHSAFFSQNCGMESAIFVFEESISLLIVFLYTTTSKISLSPNCIVLLPETLLLLKLKLNI